MKLELDLKPGDVRLLKMLSCVLILVAALNFVMLPGLEHHADLTEQRQEAEAKKEEMEDAIASVPVLRETIETQKAELSELSEDYYALMENREVDALVTGLVLNHGLFPVSLSIGETTPGVPASYLGMEEQETAESDSASEPASAGEELMAEDSGEEASAALPVSTVQYVHTTEVTVTLQGTESELRTFLNDIAKEEPAVQVRSMNLSESTYLDAELQQVRQSNISCVLAVYTCGDENSGEEQEQ